MIAYYHQSLESPDPENYPTGLYVMNSAGGERRLLLKGNNYTPCWSPDQKKILYSKFIPESEELFIIDSTGMNEIPITKNGKTNRGASWSPNGNLITWSRSIHIAVMNVDGTNLKILDYGQYPAWSSESNYIVYSNATPDFTKEVIWKINIDGSNKIQLTN